MSDICNAISKNLTSRNCGSKGGTNRNSWTFQLPQFTGAETRNATTGALSGFTLKTGEKGIKGVGRPKKGSGASKLTTAENGNSEVEQTLIQEYRFANQNDLTALEEFLKGDGKVVFQELANGKIRVYFKEFGTETSTGEEGTGVVLLDDNEIMKVTLTGKEGGFPMYFEAPISGSLTQLASSRAYLDALVVADVVEE
ncbi:hypothetical protein [Hymenobacter sp. B81]|uniref:hypothetical protein n=1 Tax=Hymenobacter sp. B81 TaxID=3344878 RepID=UPI0037DCFCA2